MAHFSFLDKKDLPQAWRESKSYMKTFQDPLDELERIAHGRPHPSIEKNYPKVTDKTTLSIVNKTPRRIIQQLPTGRVVSDTNDWLTIVASFIYTNKILLNANTQFSLFEKCIQMVKKSLQNGSKTSLTPFVMNNGKFCTDMKLIGDKDIFFEAGKLSADDSSFKFVRGWFQPRDIKKIIHDQKKLSNTEWDLKALAEIEDEITQKSDEDMTEAERNAKETSQRGGIELVTAYQEGIGAEFYTFNPKTDKVVRTKINKDPRGKTPLDTMYLDTDGVNPLGWGLVDQLAALQNLIDTEMQMYQFERALMLAPPSVTRGTWNKSKAKLVPNVMVDLGSDPNASWEVLKRDSTALDRFPENYGLMKSQLLNIAASPDTSISAEVGNPGFSKTPAGVNAQQANVSVDDNHIRKKFESWFENWSETATNLYFAEKSGIEELQVDDDTALKLRKIDPSLVTDDNIVRIDYDSATEALKFEVDASTSNMKNDQQQLEALDGLIDRLEGSAILQQFIPPKKIVGVWNSIVQASGVENPEDLIVDDEEMAEMEQQQAEVAQMEQAMATGIDPATGQPIQPELTGDPVAEQAMVHPEVPQEQPDLDAQEAEITAQLQQLDEEEAIQPEPEVELDEDETAFAVALQDMGYSDNQIQQAFAMLENNISEEEIMEMLESTRSE